MKKIFIGILAVVYMAVSSGIAMEIHYCMGKKTGVGFYNSSGDKCGMTEKKTGCCHDELKFYKLSDSHNTVTNDINFTATEIAVVNHYLFDWQMPGHIALTAVNSHSPPDYTGPSACILNCIFRL